MNSHNDQNKNFNIKSAFLAGAALLFSAGCSADSPTHSDQMDKRTYDAKSTDTNNGASDQPSYDPSTLEPYPETIQVETQTLTRTLVEPSVPAIDGDPRNPLVKIELVPERSVMVDGVNHHRLALSLSEQTIEGWGYPYYVVEGKNIVTSTLMAVPEGKEPEPAIVRGAPMMIDYNPRLPIVVYVPEGIQIGHRVWTPERDEYLHTKD